MADEKQLTMLHISASPHIRHHESVPSIMRAVIISLIPALLASVWFFGIRSVLLITVSVVFCVLTEWLIVKYLFKKETTLSDYSAVVTGILLAFNLPPSLPWWMAAIGSVFAIGVAKMAFGGLGNNFINPALAGRAFLMASYPAAMTSFAPTRAGSINGLAEQIDAVSQATPLYTFKHAFTSGNFHALDFQSALPNLFFGNVGGCIGETSALALLIGACFLWYKQIIGFSIPVTYIGTVFLLNWFFNGVTPDLLTSDALIIPTFQILAGGLFLGAFFMATDMVTSPITTKGRIVFALGCGVLTFCIRKFGGYPEGVSYSILIMNLLVPLIDRYMRPVLYGKVRNHG
jgi:electron transport complex protein RnfD